MVQIMVFGQVEAVRFSSESSNIVRVITIELAPNTIQSVSYAPKTFCFTHFPGQLYSHALQPGCDMRICMTTDPAGFICRSVLYTILKCSFQVLRYPDTPGSKCLAEGQLKTNKWEPLHAIARCTLAYAKRTLKDTRMSPEVVGRPRQYMLSCKLSKKDERA